MARVLYMGLPFPAEPQKTAPSSSSSSSPSKPLKLPHRTCSTNISIPSTAKGGGNRLLKTQKLNSEVSPHRAVSAVRLMRIELGGAFADLLNEKGKGSGENEMGYVQRTLGFRTRELNHHDLRLVTDIVGGTIRWRRYLDHLISSLCHDKDISSMEPLLLQNVKLAKFALRPGAGNMVNGILRKLVVLKEKESLPLPKVEGDDRAQARALATLYSHPVIIIQAGLLKKGLCSVQDESAGLVVSVVDPQPGETIIDCCAAPGGKTLYMASHLSGQGKVFAIDVNSGRLRILKETAKLHQVDGVITAIHADLRTLPDSGQLKSNKVLLDAPCSGLGVLSKRADLRWNKNLEDMEQLKELQDELLDAASKLVKPGGVLVYSTCSIDPEENDDRVVAFLARHSDFHIDPVDRYVPPDFETSSGFFFSNPVKHSLDGSFAARLVRDL
ncbi:hypothetical protein JHK85_005971 [Glycine max]|nr:hypothetical protein JHK85_005971 [Glycine max]